MFFSLVLGASVFIATSSGSTGDSSSRTYPAGVLQPGAELTVRLVVLSPTGALLSRFGHTAIWIHDSISGRGKAYNYGQSMPEPGLIRRLAGGGVLAQSSASDPSQLLSASAAMGRSVWIQELAFTPSQRLALRAYLESTQGPTAPSYRQDFYRANCTTAIRDAIDWALDGRLRASTQDILSPNTFRFHTNRYAGDYPLFYAALSLVLGRSVDQPITTWEELFLPETLMAHLRTLTVALDSGEEVPLVASEELWHDARVKPVRQAPPAYWLMYLTLGLILSGSMMILGRTAQHSRVARAALGIIASLWLAAAGTLGLILVWFWTLTDQSLAHWNENLLLLNPLALLALDRFITAHLGSVPALRHTRWLAGIMAVAAMAALLLKLVPGISQANADILLIAAPTHLVFAYVACRCPPFPAAPIRSDQHQRTGARDRQAIVQTSGSV